MFNKNENFKLIVLIFTMSLVMALSFYLTKKYNVNPSSISDALIAIATIVATYIHIDSNNKQRINRQEDIATQRADRLLELERQRKERLWDINKNMLIELSDSLSKVIDACHYYMHVEYVKQSINSEDIDELMGKPPHDNVFEIFREKRDLAMRVYKPLMSRSLVERIEHEVVVDDTIRISMVNQEMESDEAYELSLEAYKSLQAELQAFIIDISGVNRMTLPKDVDA